MCVCLCVCVGGGLGRETGSYGGAEKVKVKGGLVAHVPGHTLEEATCSQSKTHLSKVTKERS